MNTIAKLLLIPPTLLLLSGCVHAISSELRQSAVPADIDAVLKESPMYTGSLVIWGGVIIGTVNGKENTTVTVLETPLDSYGYPADRDRSRGRFLAETPAYLDPEVYRNGGKVTVAGEVTGTRKEPLGQTEHLYPVLRIRQIHLWKPDRYMYPYGAPYRPYEYWPYSPFFIGGGVMFRGHEGHRD